MVAYGLGSSGFALRADISACAEQQLSIKADTFHRSSGAGRRNRYCRARARAAIDRNLERTGDRRQSSRGQQSDCG